MGIRETLNQKPAITTGATAAIILIALGIIVWQLIGSGAISGGGGGGGVSTSQLYYSDDDGATWFADDASKLPPFDHNGKIAYQAFVWTCDGGKTKFCSHLKRFTDDAKKKITEARAKAASGTSGAGDASIEMAMAQGIEVKLVGNGDDLKNWIKQNDPAAGAIVNPKCKNGNQNDIEPVMP